MPPASYWLLKGKDLPYYGLPNILAGEFVVPEIIQADATPQNLSQALLNPFADEPVRMQLARRFGAMSDSLRRGAAPRRAGDFAFAQGRSVRAVKRITSAANVRYKALLKLAHSSRERRKAGLSLLDGIHLVSAYRDHVGMPEEVAVSASASERQEIRDLLATLQPLQPLLLTNVLFRALSTVETPTGVIAAVRTPQPSPAAEISHA
jgi:hypothetical protein